MDDDPFIDDFDKSFNGVKIFGKNIDLDWDNIIMASRKNWRDCSVNYPSVNKTSATSRSFAMHRFCTST